MITDRAARPSRCLGLVALVVDDYDRAISYFVDRLGFELVADEHLSSSKRWVEVTPSRGAPSRLLLARAVGARQEAAIGDQCGGRVFLFLETSDFDGDYHRFRDRGVRFVEAPRQEPYGRVVVFEDLWGNRWDLIEPHRPTSGAARP